MKTKHLLSAACVIMLAMYSCKKEEFENTSSTSSKSISLRQAQPHSIVEKTFTNSKGESETMLHFKNFQEYFETLDYLNEIYEAHDEDFVNQYPSLDDDELTEKEQEIGFNAYEPLLDFQANNRIDQTLLSDYISQENVWKATNAKGTPFFYNTWNIDLDMLTLSNPNGAVSVGNNIVLSEKSGDLLTFGTIDKVGNLDSYFDYKNGAITKFQLINNANIDVFLSKGSIISPLDCIDGMKDTEANDNMSHEVVSSKNGRTYLVKYRTQFRKFGKFACRLNGRMWHYHRQANGNLTNTRTEIGISLHLVKQEASYAGEYFVHCENYGGTVHKNHLTKRKKEYARRIYQLGDYYIKSGTSYANYHWTDNNFEIISTLEN